AVSVGQRLRRCLLRRRDRQVDRDAAAMLLGGADVHPDPAAGVAAAAEAPRARSDADTAAPGALGGALEQDAVGAQRRGFFAQLAHHRIALVLLAIGERAAGGFQQRDLFVG